MNRANGYLAQEKIGDLRKCNYVSFQNPKGHLKRLKYAYTCTHKQFIRANTLIIEENLIRGVHLLCIINGSDSCKITERVLESLKQGLAIEKVLQNVCNQVTDYTLNGVIIDQNTSAFYTFNVGNLKPIVIHAKVGVLYITQNLIPSRHQGHQQLWKRANNSIRASSTKFNECEIS